MIHSFRFSSGFLTKVVFIAVILTVFLVYVPSLNNGFVNWDDDVHLLENRFLRSLDKQGIKDIFTTTVNQTYIPLSSLSFALEYKFFGANPFIYHLSNLVLHLIVTGLVMILARRLGLSIAASAMAGLIFGIHPLHVESVAWVTQRKDVLYSVFYLASILAYLKFLNSSSKRYLVLSVTLGLLSILSKSMALSLPGILLLLDWFYRGKVSYRDVFNKLYYAVVMAPVAWMTYFSNSQILSMTSLSDLLVWIWCFNFYLIRFIVPGDAVLFYSMPYPVSLQNSAYLINLLVFILICIGMWLGRRNRLLVFAFLYYVGSIFFILRFHTIIDAVSGRFMYLPSLGLCLLIAVVMEHILKLSQKKFLPFCAILCALTILLSVAIWQTQSRIDIWHDSVSLWQNQLANNTKTAKWLAYSKLGDAYLESDSVQNALYRIKMHYRKVNGQAQDVDYPEKQADAIQIRQAIELYRSAIYDKPTYAEPYYSLGRIYQLQGGEATAIQFYEQAVHLNKNHFKAYLRLGDCYRQMGWHEKAIESYKRAVLIRPGNPELLSEIMRVFQVEIDSGGQQMMYIRAKEEILASQI